MCVGREIWWAMPMRWKNELRDDTLHPNLSVRPKFSYSIDVQRVLEVMKTLEDFGLMTQNIDPNKFVVT
jgi:hypothetical protein